jgi:outer membrane protein OmpA-like peptidoglycan-associated protein
MTSTLAHLRHALVALVLASAITGCASLPPPTSELAAAQQAVARADAATDMPLPPEPGATAGAYAARLQALAADPRLNTFAALERLQAQQALDALAQARSRDRAEAESIADRRVRAAEAAAWAQAVERDAERLEREARDLQLEATRREAAEARAEADRLRLEAQVRAEEAERLRQQALAEEQARQQAEQALQGATTQQAARVSAAREKELALAREEAALVAGAELPPVRRTERGEVFTLAGDAFPSGQSTLTAAALARLKALAAYVDLAQASGVRVEGHTDAQGDAQANLALSERRAEAVRRALVQAGVPAARIEAEGRGAAQPVSDNASAAGRAKNRRVEIVVQTK